MQLATTDTGSGPSLVLLHGFPLDRTIFDHQTQVLARHYRVIVPDLRGLGASPPTEGVYTMTTLADDVLETLDALGVTGPFVLGGLSMGGYVALELAARHPSRLRALMLMASRADADRPEAAANRRALAAKVIEARSTEPVIDAFLPRVLGESTKQHRPELVAHVRTIMQGASLLGVVGCLNGMAERANHTDTLQGIKVPALVLCGEEDPIAPISDCRAMTQSLPQGRLEVIAESGHLITMEQPESTTNAMRGFLDGLSA